LVFVLDAIVIDAVIVDATAAAAEF